MPVTSERLLTAAKLAAQNLKDEASLGSRCLVIGETGIEEAFNEAGFSITQEARQTDYVIIGMDRALTYDERRLFYEGE